MLRQTETAHLSSRFATQVVYAGSLLGTSIRAAGKRAAQYAIEQHLRSTALTYADLKAYARQAFLVEDAPAIIRAPSKRALRDYKAKPRSRVMLRTDQVDQVTVFVDRIAIGTLRRKTVPLDDPTQANLTRTSWHGEVLRHEINSSKRAALRDIEDLVETYQPTPAQLYSQSIWPIPADLFYPNGHPSLD